MEATEGKLKSLTMEEKLLLINLVESGIPVKDVAEQQCVNRNTLFYILKNKDKIRDSMLANPGLTNFKRIKTTKSPELEQRVHAFMQKSRLEGKKISGSVVKSMALEIAAELEVQNFAASNGWLFSFFKRNGIVLSEFNKGCEPAESEGSSLQNNKYIKYIGDVKDKPAEQSHESDEFEDVAYIVAEEQEEDHQLESEVISEEYEVEHEELQEELPWRYWCRLCGHYESLSEIESKHLEIIHQLSIAVEDDFRVCEECISTLDEVHKMVSKGLLVEKMFADLQERESQERLSEEDMLEIRKYYGLDSEISDEVTEDYLEEAESEDLQKLETEELEEIIYEEIESSSVVEAVEVKTEESHDIELYEEEEPLHDDEEMEYENQDENSYIFKCHICNETFDQMCYLSNHTRKEHKALPKVACSCGRILSTWDSLLAHRRRHDKAENNFSCDLCKSKFRTKTGLSIHHRFKHERPMKNLQCPTCDRIFKDTSSLKAHIRTHLPEEQKFAYECEICGKKVVNKWSLKYHINTVHNRERNHFCHLCGRGFANNSNLRSHVISHSTENVSCEICGGNFKNRISLQSHRKVHKPENMRNFPCSSCNKSFHNRNHLRRHMISHSGEKSFKCVYENCTSEYKYEKDLKNHIAGVHTGERPHKCMFCDKTFVDSANARKHKVKDHPDEVAAFEAEYGKGRNVSKFIKQELEIVFAEETE